MINHFKKMGVALVILIIMASCTSQKTTVETNIGEIQTSMAGSVAETITAYAETAQPTPRDTPTVSLTPQNTLTPTPFLVTFRTLTEVNCRSRTDETSDLILVLPVDFEGTAAFRDPASQYLFYTSLDEPINSCWILIELLKYSGNLMNLTAITSMPSPTQLIPLIPAADFMITTAGKSSCGNFYDMFYKNTGKQKWESWKISLSGSNSSYFYQTHGNSFYEFAGCSSGRDLISLPNGSTAMYRFSIPETNAVEIIVSVTLCSEDALEGLCLLRTISFNK